MQISPHNFGVLLTRLSLGTVLLAHGLLKIVVFTVPGTVAFFGSIGMPAIVAYLVIFGEIVGGTAILLGIYTRLAAILSVPILIGATWVHVGNGWVFSNQGGGWEFPVLLTVLAIVVAIHGAGAAAVRRLPVVDRFVPEFLKA